MDVIVTKEIIGIITITVMLVGLIVRLNSRIDRLEFKAAHLEEAMKHDREQFQKMLENLSHDFKHLEKNIGQMQTNLRVFIQEQGREQTEQIRELSHKLDHLKDEHNKYKVEITEKLTRS
jgi:predicted  nucleic acid-binding Zn-ribbon protein